jgi:hypothetical protein
VELYLQSPVRLNGVVPSKEKAEGQLYLFRIIISNDDKLNNNNNSADDIWRNEQKLQVLKVKVLKTIFEPSKMN